MANLIQHAKDQVSQLTAQAYAAAAAAGVLPPGVEVKGSVEIPKDPQNGDYASSFAMAGAKAMKMAPRAIAQAVVDHMDLTDSLFASVEIAGPGFLNFRLGANWYGDVLAEIEAEGPLYGQSDEGRGQKVMVEFVSANPTGPMHMGNARGGVLGDTLANILRRDGCDTWKEFYVNDAGNQIHKFAVSIQARYLQLLLGEEKVPFPEDGYHGDDIRELAQAFYDLHGDQYRDVE
ncbi:MAG: arginine--tRNA ligase, partial [Evtepia gabavorous]